MKPLFYYSESLTVRTKAWVHHSNGQTNTKAQAIRSCFPEQHCFEQSGQYSQLPPPILNYYILPNEIGDTIHSGLSSPPSSSLGPWFYSLPLILTTGWSGNNIFQKNPQVITTEKVTRANVLMAEVCYFIKVRSSSHSLLRLHQAPQCWKCFQLRWVLHTGELRSW